MSDSFVNCTVAHQAPLSIEFYRQEYCRYKIPSLMDLPDPGIKPRLLHSRQILYH